MLATLPSPRLSDLPLWRRVVALHDAEEAAGPDSESAALIRQAIIDRLSDRVPRPAAGGRRPVPDLARGYTVRDVARRLRVGEDKVRVWIKRGKLSAINVASSLCGKPQLRVTAEALAAFERARSAAPPPKPPRRRRRAEVIAFYPD